MNEINPILLLMIGLIALAVIIAWGLTIRVSVRIARRVKRNPKRWGIITTIAGPIIMGIGYLAYTKRRSVRVWIILQVLAVGAVFLSAWLFLPKVLGIRLWIDLLLLVGELLLLLLPILVLAGLPRRIPLLHSDKQVKGIAKRKADSITHGDAGDVILQAKNLHKSYYLGKQRLDVLKGVSMAVERGRFVAIVGASGSGKSTLLHLLGLLDSADSGEVSIDGIGASTLRADERNYIRCRYVGFVFQFYHLLPELNVLENVMLPAMTGCSVVKWWSYRRDVRKRAAEILDRIGLKERLNHRPMELSGGERQRVAIARALINSPEVLLADEPTGNLDSKTGKQIMELLKQLNQEGQTIVMVTHEQTLAQAADKILYLSDGRLKSQ